MHQLQVEKQARLKHFQNEVKKRVNKLDKLKKQTMMETNYKAVSQIMHLMFLICLMMVLFGNKCQSAIKPLV